MRHILYSLLAASLMTACTQDEHTGGSLPEGRVPMVLNAGGLQVTATPDTRGRLRRRLVRCDPNRRHGNLDG